MSLSTLIQWCHATVNFWWGCAKVSAGCQHCYAEKMARAFSHGRATWGPGGRRWLRNSQAVSELLKLEQRAIKKNTRLRVFINSMSDTFEDRRDLDFARKELFAIAPQFDHLDLLLLTKRVDCIERLMPEDWKTGGNVSGLSDWPGNVWLGFSAENQAAFDLRWPIVQNLAHRFGIPCIFCSSEPLLGPLNIETAQYMAGGEDEPETRPLDWLIVGGESGHQARPCNVDHIRAVVKQAHELDISVFVKQLGARAVEEKFVRRDHLYDTGIRRCRLELADSHGGDMAEWPADLRVRELPVPSFLNGIQAPNHLTADGADNADKGHACAEPRQAGPGSRASVSAPSA